MRKIICLTIFLGNLFFQVVAQKSVVITDFGAKGDSLSLNTQFIQQAIDKVAGDGGGTVIIPRGKFISGTILFRDGVNLHLEKEAYLLGSNDPRDYQSIDAFVDATGQIRGKCLIGAKNVHDIKLTGEGVIDGRGALFQAAHLSPFLKSEGVKEENLEALMADRPFLLRFVQSKGITVEGLTLRQPAAWTCHFYQSSKIKVSGVSIYSHAHKNNDGIDLDSSHGVVISDCRIDTGDDAICFKTTSPQPTCDIKVHNCELKSDWGAIKFGTESMGDFYDISIQDCQIRDTRGGGIKILSVDGANISNINISNITMSQTEMPVFIRLGERLRTYREAPKQQVGSIDGISIRNLKATTRSQEASRINPPSAIFITGTKGHRIGHIKLKNITIQVPGGGKETHRNRTVDEMPERYPEFSFFGVLPAYGMMARHVGLMEVSNVDFSVQGADKRKAILLEDIEEPKLKISYENP
ncbi:hypothetical protein GCM10028791_32050 [Echinicola sediminis]